MLEFRFERQGGDEATNSRDTGSCWKARTLDFTRGSLINRTYTIAALSHEWQTMRAIARSCFFGNIPFYSGSIPARFSSTRQQEDEQAAKLLHSAIVCHRVPVCAAALDCARGATRRGKTAAGCVTWDRRSCRFATVTLSVKVDQKVNMVAA